jgi:hypothetical protein
VLILDSAASGLLFDSIGHESTFGMSAAMLAGSAIVAVAASRAGKPAVRPAA